MRNLILNTATVAGYIAAAFATVGACNLARNLWRRRQVAELRRRETQVRRDVARFRAGRLTPPAVEQQPGDPYSDDRIDAELLFIPAQRKEGPK